MTGFIIFSALFGLNVWCASIGMKKRRWADLVMHGFLALHFSILSGAQWLTMGGVE